MNKGTFIEQLSSTVFLVRLKKKFYEPDAVIQTAGLFTDQWLERQIRLDLEKRFGNLREIIYKKAFAAVGGIS
ncbi:MAG: hypothetical protein IJ668_04110 [Selenomonadaceae bacterium]|nr:hypothetical protein [Selenomonadaceae bacterium]